MSWVLVVVTTALYLAALSDGGVVLGDALGVLCWVGAGPLAMSAAASPMMKDRVEGIEALAQLHGVTTSALAAHRLLAAASGAALRVALPGAILSLTQLVLEPSASRALAVAAAVMSGLLAGGCVGIIGALCGEVGRERGRALLLAVVLLPWIVSDVWSVPSLSLPGALDAGLSWVMAHAPHPGLYSPAVGW